VCLVDAFVYSFRMLVLNFLVLMHFAIFFAFFMLIYLRVSHEC